MLQISNVRGQQVSSRLLVLSLVEVSEFFPREKKSDCVQILLALSVGNFDINMMCFSIPLSLSLGRVFT